MLAPILCTIRPVIKNNSVVLIPEIRDPVAKNKRPRI